MPAHCYLRLTLRIRVGFSPTLLCLQLLRLRRTAELIVKRLIESNAFRSSKSVSCFLSMAGEVDTDGIVREALSSGKLCSVIHCTVLSDVGFRKDPIRPANERPLY